MIKPIYEFLVWDNCNNNCKFCFQRLNPKFLNHQQQEKVLDDVITYIDSKEFIPGSHVLIVGGEIFDDVQRFAFLYSFFTKICERMKNNIIDILYLNTNLIYSQKSIDFIMKVLTDFQRNNILNRLHFTTSYDLSGRFKTDNDKQIFISNLEQISRIENSNVIVNMILTKQFCQDTLNGRFDPFDFIQKNKVNINLIPYIILDEQLSPSRSDVFRLFKHIYDIDKRFAHAWVHELDLKQPRKMIKFYGPENMIRCECDMSDCGHSVNFKRYSNNGSCFVCDILNFYMQLEESR